MENVSVVTTFFWPSIVGHLTVVSNLLSNGKSNYCFNNFFACIVGNLSVVSTTFWLWLQAIFPSFQLFFKWKISPLFQYFFGLRLQGCYPLFQFFSLIGNLTVYSKNFCPCILSNLSVVPILISLISPLFQQFFVLRLQAISPLFQFFALMGKLTVVSTIFTVALKAIYLLF